MSQNEPRFATPTEIPRKLGGENSTTGSAAVRAGSPVANPSLNGPHGSPAGSLDAHKLEVIGLLRQHGILRAWAWEDQETALRMAVALTPSEYRRERLGSLASDVQPLVEDIIEWDVRIELVPAGMARPVGEQWARIL